MVVENYPNLKASENFKQLQFELEGTENRILQSRRRYNEAVQKYNTDLSLFPGEYRGVDVGIPARRRLFQDRTRCAHRAQGPVLGFPAPCMTVAAPRLGNRPVSRITL